MTNKQLIIELKEIINNLEQYRLLTNKLINNHVSQHDIENFIEKEYIKSTDNHYYDYEYDLYNWLDIMVLEEIVNKLKEEGQLDVKNS